VFTGAIGVLKRLVWPISVIIIIGAKFVDDVEFCNVCSEFISVKYWKIYFCQVQIPVAINVR
jgi:hypothetical protein